MNLTTSWSTYTVTFTQGRLVFVLPTALGRVEIRSDVKPPDIRHALKVMASREARLR